MGLKVAPIVVLHRVIVNEADPNGAGIASGICGGDGTLLRNEVCKVFN